MEPLLIAEIWVGRLAGLGVAVALGMIFYGVVTGTRRLRSGRPETNHNILSKPLFYFFTGTAFFILCRVLWRSLSIDLSDGTRVAAITIGSPLMFCGIALVIWGRLTLGRNYFVSTSRTALLFSDHELITTGPYAIVRHPMYLGILLITIGGLVLYRTWTMIFLVVIFFLLPVRARREEQALAKAFGDQWGVYCKHVPAWIPRLGRNKTP